MLTYTFKFRPKAKRDGYLYDKIDRHNMLWNKMVWLEEVSQKCRKGQKNRHINGTVMNRYVNLHKKGHGWDYMIKGLDAQSIQADIQRREVSFDRFFKWAKERKEGKHPKKKESPPTYKRVHGDGSFTLKQTGYRLTSDAVEIGNFYKKDTHTNRFFASRKIEGKVKTCTIRRDREGNIWTHIVTDHTPHEEFPKTGIEMGFDFGSDPFFTDSDGNKWNAPAILGKHFAELRKLDKRIGRCKDGSKNKERLYAEKRTIERRIRDTRDDWQWEMAREMCRRFDVMCFEGLDLAEMGEHNKEKEKDMTPSEKGNMKKWRRKLRDYAPGAFIEKVKWIAKKAGKTVWIGDKWDATTQKCHECGYRNKALKNPKIKKWVCPVCGAVHDRDINAAKNVLAAYRAWKAEQEKKTSKKGRNDLKGDESCAGGASSVDVGQSGDSARESRWARIRKTKKPQGVFAGLAVDNHHGTQTQGDCLLGGIPQASAVGGCQMTYGDYLRDYPQGQKHENAKPDEYGYCMINNEDKNNICWLSKESYHLINQGFMALRALREDPMGKKGMAGAKKIHQLLTKQIKISVQEAAKERKARAYIVQARDEFSDLMLNATAAQWAAILRLVKTVHKDAETIWLMTNEWKEKQKAERTSKSKKRKGK